MSKSYYGINFTTKINIPRDFFGKIIMLAKNKFKTIIYDIKRKLII